MLQCRIEAQWLEMMKEIQGTQGRRGVGATPAYVKIARAWMSAREEGEGRRPKPELSGLRDASGREEKETTGYIRMVG
jgi:hypothetical protein